MIKRLIVPVFLSIFLCSGFTFSNTFKSELPPAPRNSPEYAVTKVIDGDTIEVEKLGKIRYIGIDTPEIHHPAKGVEPYGFEALVANRRLVGGQKVKLEFDLQQRDKYGRILAYVYVGQIFVNAYLVEAGFAQIMTIPPNVKYAGLFLELQKEARAANRGLWGGIAPPGSTGRYVGSIKGFTYHHPECKWAKMIKAGNQVWFNSREEAEKAGYHPCGTCKP